MASDHRASLTALVSTHDLGRHVVDAGLPNVAFLVLYKTMGPTEGVVAAVAAGLLLVGVRLLQRQSLKVIVAAFGLVILHAGIVLTTGDGEDFFLPWLVLHATLTVGFTASLIVRRPLTARLSRFSGLTADPARHQQVTALWTGLWALHVAVGLPLYLAGRVVALGLAHFLLGPPALLLWGYLTWRLLRQDGDSRAGATS